MNNHENWYHPLGSHPPGQPGFPHINGDQNGQTAVSQVNAALHSCIAEAKKALPAEVYDLFISMLDGCFESEAKLQLAQAVRAARSVGNHDPAGRFKGKIR
ncbi:MAG: hypothetical protein M1814_002860 [Vezdaea aestivalis]|nr:MAG: hypothetical protein M1814_002860 [Vezdaea aestivalis]